MHTLHRSAYGLAMCLSALAGCVDAIGFLHLSGFFLSFMSGNSTQLAVNLVTGNLHKSALLAAILALFVTGAMLGTLARQTCRHASPAVRVLALVSLLLGGALLSHIMRWDALVVACMTMAMGAENAVFQRDNDVIGLTYMTGTLVKLGQRLALAMLGGAKFAWAPYLLLWLGLIAGGVTGAILFITFGLGSLWFAAAWAVLLTGVAGRVKT